MHISECRRSACGRKKVSEEAPEVQPLKIKKKGANHARACYFISSISAGRGHNIAFAARIARLSIEEDSDTGRRRGWSCCIPATGYALTPETVIRWQCLTLNRARHDAGATGMPLKALSIRAHYASQGGLHHPAGISRYSGGHRVVEAVALKFAPRREHDCAQCKSNRTGLLIKQTTRSLSLSRSTNRQNRSKSIDWKRHKSIGSWTRGFLQSTLRLCVKRFLFLFSARFISISEFEIIARKV